VIKRVVGLEGDFIKVRASAPLKIVHVPAGQVWLEGDNTAWSYDSNSYGPVPVNLIEVRSRMGFGTYRASG
jgi:inner membrane protease subunit 2